MQHRISKWTVTTAITAALVFGFITPANGDTTAAAQATQAAAAVQAKSERQTSSTQHRQVMTPTAPPSQD
jgi:hypothetical protein